MNDHDQEWKDTDRAGRDHPPAPKHVEKTAEEIAGEAYQVISEMIGLNPMFMFTPEAKALLDYFSRDWKIPGKEILPFALPRLQPSKGLLMSMALRYDHGLGMSGYYDQTLFSGTGLSHKQRLEGTMTTMSQVWEEATGNGFYKPGYEESYASQANSILQEVSDEKHAEVPADGDVSS